MFEKKIMDKFIVAEITKNWGLQHYENDLLSQQFEKVINFNYNRFYNLKEWKLTSFITTNAQGKKLLTETIVAIFELDEERRV